MRAPGDAITIDVKTVAGRFDWPAANAVGPPRQQHYVVLLAYDGRFEQVAGLPKAWVLPHAEFLPLVKTAKMRYVLRSLVAKLEHRREAWRLLRTAGT